MSILEFLGFPPVFRGFAARLQRAMPAESGQWTFDPDRGSLRQSGGTEVTLHNMFLEYRSSGVFGRAALIRKYADLAFAQACEIPALWVAAAKNIYPVVRSEFLECTLDIRSRETGVNLDQVVFPMAGDLRIRLAYDFGNTVGFVKGHDLSTWGQSSADVLERARANLGRLEMPTWVDSERGYFHLTSPMSYAESMLLLDSVIDALPFAAHAVFLPCNRGILLTADERSDAAITAMLAEAARCLQHEPWPMTVTLCKRTPEGWRDVAPPATAAALAHNLFVRHRAEYYAAQKQELDALHERTDEDLFVASYSLCGNDEQCESFCVWGEGVKTLLPVTDWVAVVPQEEKGKFIRVPWQHVVESCGPHLQATEENPPRFLVDSFPNPNEWDSLSARAIVG